MTSTIRTQGTAATAIGFRRGWIFAFLFFLNALNYLDRVVISVASQPIAQEFSLSPVQLGYLFSSFLWSYVLCMVPIGIILDRWGSRGPIAIGLAFWSLMTMLAGVAGNYTMLFMTRLGLGVGESVTQPAGSKVLREWVPMSERGVAFTIFNAGIYAGPAIGIPFVAWITGLLGWRGAVLILGAIGFVWIVAWQLWYRSPEEARWLTEPERQKIIAERGDAVVMPPRSMGAQWATLLRSPAMWGVFITGGCNVYTQYLFLSWLPNYLQTTRGLSLLKTGFYAAIPYVIAVVLGIAISKFTDRLFTPEAVQAGKRRIVIAVLMLGSSVILLAPWVEQLWLIVALISIALTGISTSIALVTALTTELLRDPHSQGKAVSLLVIGGNVFGLSAPIITGYLVASTGSFDWAFISAGLLLVIGAIAVLTMTRKPIG